MKIDEKNWLDSGRLLPVPHPNITLTVFERKLYQWRHDWQISLRQQAYTMDVGASILGDSVPECKTKKRRIKTGICESFGIWDPGYFRLSSTKWKTLQFQ
jgi:hypothetical protein